MLFKSVAAMAALSMAAAPVVVQAETRPAPVKLLKQPGSRLGVRQTNVDRADAVQGERENLALGLLPLLGIFVGVAVVAVVVTQVTGNSSPN